MRISAGIVAVSLSAALCVPCGAAGHGGNPAKAGHVARGGGHGGGGHAAANANHAGRAAKANNQNAAAQAEAVWLVTAVNAASNSVTLQTSDAKQTKSCRVDGLTMVTVNGKDGKIEDVKPGMKASFGTAADPAMLTTLAVSDNAAAAPARKQGRRQAPAPGQ